MDQAAAAEGFRSADAGAMTTPHPTAAGCFGTGPVPTDPAGANVLYVFIVDPALKGADYQVSNIITEAFGNTAETNEILKKYVDCFAQGMNIVNLNLVQDLGK